MQITHDNLPKGFTSAEVKVKDVNVYLIGPAATHDYSCPICRSNHAVLDFSSGVMEPCWSCQSKGWGLIKKKPSFWERFNASLGRRFQ
ncbi:MAG: hypothetical protein QM489_00950 [Candidatus Izemoplasma sp.]